MASSSSEGEKPVRDEEFYYLLTEGSELLQAGKVDDARGLFERALTMNPTHEQALNLLGLSLFRLNQLDRARQIFADLVHNNPIEPSLRLNLAMVHLKTGRLDDAKIELERVLELNPDHPRATSYMGLVLERQGDLDRAAEYYERAGNTKRADEIRAYRPTKTGTFPLPNLQQMIAAAAKPAPDQPASSSAGPQAQAPNASPKPISSITPLASVTPAATPSTPPSTTAPATTVIAKPAPSTLVSGGTEAAALTAATAAMTKRATEPPAAAAVENARGSSLGFTLEVDEKAKAPSMGASSAPPPNIPPSTPSSSTASSSTASAPSSSAPQLQLVTGTPANDSAPSSTPAGAAPAIAAAWARAKLPDAGLAELVAGAVSAEEPVLRDDGILAFPVPDVGYVRTDLLVALSGQFEIEPVNRRYRGKRTDSLFGGPEAAIVALLGKGLALLHPDKLSPRSLTLKSEELYLVEGALLAFTQGLVWENGRLPSETDKDLDIVHLRGSGRLILGTKSPVMTLPVKPDHPVTVHAPRLVGWNGQLVPYRAPLPGLPDAARRIPVVRFEGTGFVLAV